MDKRIEELRDINLELEQLRQKKEDIKKKAQEHRSAVSEAEIRAALEEADNAKAEIEQINQKINELEARKAKLAKQNAEKGELRNMEVKVLHLEDGMERADILSTVEYRRAFFKRLQGKELTAEEQRAMTSAMESGGAAIPTQTMDEILGQLQESPTLVGLVTVLNIPNLITLPIENVTTDANWIAEEAESTAGNDTLRSISLSAHKLIRLVEITAKLQAMSVPAFERWIISTLVKKMRAAIEKAIISGTGVGQPAGVESLTFNETNSITTNSNITYDNLVDLESLLGEDYEANAVFVMNKKTLAQVKKLKDDTKKPIFERIAEDGFKGALLGYPVRRSKYVPDGVIYLADWKAAYVINFTQSVEISESREAGFKSGNTVYRGLALLDGKPTGIPGSIVKLIKTSD